MSPWFSYESFNGKSYQCFRRVQKRATQHATRCLRVCLLPSGKCFSQSRLSIDFRATDHQSNRCFQRESTPNSQRFDSIVYIAKCVLKVLTTRSSKYGAKIMSESRYWPLQMFVVLCDMLIASLGFLGEMK